MEKQNHWKTPKGKETLYNVFTTLVALEEKRLAERSRKKIWFWDIPLNLKLRTGKNYKKAYIVHALNELIRLGFVRKNIYNEFWITPAGWEFWKKRKQGARA